VVAEFFNENPVTVEVFPTSWLTADKTECFWPTKCTSKLLRTAKSIPFKDWKKCSCRVLKDFGKLNLINLTM